MPHRILVIQGHPDASAAHLCHALAAAYVAAAEEAGHGVRTCDVATLDFALLRSQAEFEHGPVPDALHAVQADILWASHLVLVFPLWAGGMPALLKGFFEQVFRPAFTGTSASHFGKKLLDGRSARLIVTMGMPALVYRWFFRAHSLKALERSLLGMVGIAPVRETLIGQTGDMAPEQAATWLRAMQELGRHGT